MRTGARNVLVEEILSKQMSQVMKTEQRVHKEREGKSIKIKDLSETLKNFTLAMLECEKENKKK